MLRVGNMTGTIAADSLVGRAPVTTLSGMLNGARCWNPGLCPGWSHRRIS